jgi:alpha-galactosidase
MDLTRLCSTPDHLNVDLGAGYRPLAGSGVSVDWHAGEVWIAAPSAELCAVRLRWLLSVPDEVLCLGDAWERGYGDLEWRGVVPERCLPWYVLLRDGSALHGWGVATGGAAFAWWQVDAAGITLHLDVRNGGQGVRLGTRRLHAATIVVRPGTAGEDQYQAARAVCAALCPRPRLPAQPVYGLNDWYYAYAANSAETVLRDGRVLAELTTGLENRPYHVIDAGWSGTGSCPGGPWAGNARFGDMSALAAAMRQQGSRPGLWVRPLTHHRQGIPAAWELAAQRQPEHDNECVLDSSLPEVREHVSILMRLVTGWGFQLVKHDFTTFDLTGRWGFQMGHRPTADGWRFRDDSLTTAEVVRGLYQAIREGAGDAAVLGCNTIGHLSAGLFEISRTGDDTSGRNWERTRKMGPNTLAMRMPQHGTFHAVDADCVGLTAAVPWELNRQWLDVLARSGTPLFVSPDPQALGPEQRQALQRAFAIAAAVRSTSQPLDWASTTEPRRWRHADGEATYDWQDNGGAVLPCPP